MITFNVLLNKRLVNKSRKTTQKTFTIIINIIINSSFNENVQMNLSIAKKVQDFDVTIFNFITDLIFTVNQNVKYDDKFKIDEFIAKLII